MKVTCSTNKVMICTPWVKCATSTDEAINVTDLVMTAGLANGDSIIAYNGGFKGWTWNGTAWEGAAVSGTGGTVASGTADDASITRGEGFWFIKSGYTSGTYDLYLYGQATTASATSSITAGAYNLVANPNVAAFDIKGKITNAANGDSIQLGGGKIFKYAGGKWTTTSTSTVKGRTVVSTGEASAISIPAGAGFWYVSTGSSNVSIAWQ